MAKKKNQNEKKSSTSPLVSGIIKLAFEFIKKAIHDWDKKSGNVEMKQKYKSLERHFDKDLNRLKNRIEKLTMRILWMNMLIIILIICLLIQLIFIITNF